MTFQISNVTLPAQLFSVRGAFLDILAKHLDSSYVHFNKRCIDIATVEGSTSTSIVTFDDGATVEADVVLLANGIKCPLRKAVTGRDIDVVWGANVCYRGLVTREETEKKGIDTNHWSVPSIVLGNNKVRVWFSRSEFSG